MKRASSRLLDATHACAACVRAGLPCRSIIARGDECPVQGAANLAWWLELLRGGLAPSVTATCLELTEQRDLGRGQAATSLRIRGGRCTGCASRPTPACELPATWGRGLLAATRAAGARRGAGRPPVR